MELRKRSYVRTEIEEFALPIDQAKRIVFFISELLDNVDTKEDFIKYMEKYDQDYMITYFSKFEETVMLAQPVNTDLLLSIEEKIGEHDTYTYHRSLRDVLENNLG